jgi:hypothetical protein
MTTVLRNSVYNHHSKRTRRGKLSSQYGKPVFKVVQPARQFSVAWQAIRVSAQCPRNSSSSPESHSKFTRTNTRWSCVESRQCERCCSTGGRGKFPDRFHCCLKTPPRLVSPHKLSPHNTMLDSLTDQSGPHISKPWVVHKMSQTCS